MITEKETGYIDIFQLCRMNARLLSSKTANMNHLFLSILMHENYPLTKILKAKFNLDYSSALAKFSLLKRENDEYNLLEDSDIVIDSLVMDVIEEAKNIKDDFPCALSMIFVTHKSFSIKYMLNSLNISIEELLSALEIPKTA